jgi:hypothetical protein
MSGDFGYVIQGVNVALVNGDFSVSLVPVDAPDLSATSWVYYAAVYSGGKIVARKTFQVFAAQATVDWADLAEAVPEVQFASGVTLGQVTALLEGYLAHSDSAAENTTYTLDRPSPLANPGSALDLFRFTYGGERGLYANEFACGRGRDPVGNQVAFRCQCHSSDNGTSQAIFEAAHADNTAMLRVRADGDTEIFRDLDVGRDITVGRDVIYVEGWVDAESYGTGIAGSGGDPWYPFGVRLEAGGRVFMRGRVNTAAGVTYTADNTILTLPATHRPAKDVVYTMRSAGGAGAVNSFMRIFADGRITFNTTLNLTGGQVASWPFDGYNYVIAV